MLLARNGVKTRLLARTAEEAQELESARENRRFLPGFPFPTELHATASPEEAFLDSDLVAIVVPSRTMRENVRRVAGHLPSSCTVMSATKGLEIESGKRMSQLLDEELPVGLRGSVCVLSGPNLAKEIVAGKPASTVIASANEAVAIGAQRMFNSTLFRVYTNLDVVGVELGGSLKNIIALGAGIADGLDYGDNGKAAFITRGLAEITRLGIAAGANPLTLAGLAGLGDLTATCASRLSRNRSVGEQLAGGRLLSEILASMDSVAEGVDTTAAALTLADSLGVDMPLTRAIYRVLFEDLDPRAAVAELMSRAPRPE